MPPFRSTMLHTDGEPNELYEFNEPNVAPTARRVIWFLFLPSDMYLREMDVKVRIFTYVPSTDVYGRMIKR